MTASTAQPRARQIRRIIERPRLMRLLDETPTGAILLLAPAGYGKTTLARQWVRTVSRTLWISATPAHRDVVTFCEDIADKLAELDAASAKVVREYTRAHPSSRRAGDRVGRKVADRLRRASVRWLMIDDYHELSQAPEIENVVDVIRVESGCRLLIASRSRPAWARARQTVYGELTEIHAEALAMTTDESRALLGDRGDLARLSHRARGWPAVLALAGRLDDLPVAESVFPSSLHEYLAQEVFTRATGRLQSELLRAALLPPAAASSGGYPELMSDELLDEATELGFFPTGDPASLHPLLREFLLERLSERTDGRAQIFEAVEWCKANENWAHALELVARFSCDELIEQTLDEALTPLARAGQLETLSIFVDFAKRRPLPPPAAIALVEAEVALRDGNLALSEELARRAESKLLAGHRLRSRASAIRGRSLLLRGASPEAEEAFASARSAAQDAHDEIEALYGIAHSRIFREESNTRSVVEELLARRHESPALLVRATTVELARRRFEEGLAGDLRIAEAEHAYAEVKDPRVRSSYVYTVAYTLGQRAEYLHARSWLAMLWRDIDEFDLEFARPHALWASALVQLGLRRFGEAERSLQSLEDSIANSQPMYRRPNEQVNAKSLRARLLIQTGKPAEAVELTREAPDECNYASWRAEYIATRSLALACVGDDTDALDAASAADATSRVAEVRTLTAASRAVVDARHGEIAAAATVFAIARGLGTWDPVVCALRASHDLSDGLADLDVTRDEVRRLYAASNDLGLARRAGFRTRSTRAPGEVLTPRELEVLGLIAQGLTNRDIAAALYISNSTAKVHARHVFEKLGVRTRAQAVARYEMFNDATASG